MRLQHPPSLAEVHVLAPRGLSYVVLGFIALAHAYAGHWVLSTIGEPYRQTVEQNDRIQATAAIAEGVERRSLLSLQTGLTRASELATFNETLFDDAKALHRTLRKRLDALTAAVEAGAETIQLSRRKLLTSGGARGRRWRQQRLRRIREALGE